MLINWHGMSVVDSSGKHTVITSGHEITLVTLERDLHCNVLCIRRLQHTPEI